MVGYTSDTGPIDYTQNVWISTLRFQEVFEVWPATPEQSSLLSRDIFPFYASLLILLVFMSMYIWASAEPAPPQSNSDLELNLQFQLEFWEGYQISYIYIYIYHQESIFAHLMNFCAFQGSWFACQCLSGCICFGSFCFYSYFLGLVVRYV